MLKAFLMVDFGASHTKTAIVDMATARISHLQHHASLGNIASEPGHYEISLQALHQQFLGLCASYEQLLDGALAGVVICSQMHGFIVVDANHQPLTEYISWRDERSLESVNGVATFDLVMQAVGKDYLAITGMRPRASLAFMNALHVFKKRVTPSPAVCKLLSLPEWIALCHNDARPVTHASLQIGLGFHDVETRRVSPELLTFFEQQAQVRLLFNETPDEMGIAGYYHVTNHRVPIYAGVGDLQCALLGAGIQGQAVSINIGTGSQVSILNGVANAAIERRPYFNRDYLLTQTHIPAGRALTEYMGFLAQTCQYFCNIEVDVWSILNTLTVKDLLDSDLQVDLAIFNGAYGYHQGGSITHIHEGRLTLHNYCASLLKQLLLQYRAVALQLDPSEKAIEYVFSGGVARKLPILLTAFAELTGKKLRLASLALDETFLGLRLLAFACERQESDYTKLAVVIEQLEDARGCC